MLKVEPANRSGGILDPGYRIDFTSHSFEVKQHGQYGNKTREPYLARADVYSTEAVAGWRSSRPVAVCQPLSSAVTCSITRTLHHHYTVTNIVLQVMECKE